MPQSGSSINSLSAEMTEMHLHGEEEHTVTSDDFIPANVIHACLCAGTTNKQLICSPIRTQNNKACFL